MMYHFGVLSFLQCVFTCLLGTNSENCNVTKTGNSNAITSFDDNRYTLAISYKICIQLINFKLSSLQSIPWLGHVVSQNTSWLKVTSKLQPKFFVLACPLFPTHTTTEILVFTTANMHIPLRSASQNRQKHKPQ